MSFSNSGEAPYASAVPERHYVGRKTRSRPRFLPRKLPSWIKLGRTAIDEKYNTQTPDLFFEHGRFQLLSKLPVEIQGFMWKKTDPTKRWKNTPNFYELRSTFLLEYQKPRQSWLARRRTKASPTNDNYIIHKIVDLRNNQTRIIEESRNFVSFSFSCETEGGVATVFLAAPTKSSTLSWIQALSSASYSVALDEFHPIARIGAGQWGSAFVASRQLEDSREIVAVKEVQVHDHTNLNHVIQERCILAALPKHPFIVDFHFALRQHNYLYLIMEFGAGGDLFSRMQKARPSRAAVVLYSAEILLALQHLHKHAVIYRDLKPENILLKLNGHILLADMGLSKILLSADHKTSTFCGTESYLAPEVLVRRPYGLSADAWQFGCVVFELHCGRSPFWRPRGPGRRRQAEAILAGAFQAPTSMPADAKTLVGDLLQVNPVLRAACGPGGWDALKEYKFFRKVDFARLRDDEARTARRARAGAPLGQADLHFALRANFGWAGPPAPPAAGAGAGAAAADSGGGGGEPPAPVAFSAPAAGEGGSGGTPQSSGRGEGGEPPPPGELEAGSSERVFRRELERGGRERLLFRDELLGFEYCAPQQAARGRGRGGGGASSGAPSSSSEAASPGAGGAGAAGRGAAGAAAEAAAGPAPAGGGATPSLPGRGGASLSLPGPGSRKASRVVIPLLVGPGGEGVGEADSSYDGPALLASTLGRVSAIMRHSSRLESDRQRRRSSLGELGKVGEEEDGDGAERRQRSHCMFEEGGRQKYVRGPTVVAIAGRDRVFFEDSRNNSLQNPLLGTIESKIAEMTDEQLQALADTLEGTMNSGGIPKDWKNSKHNKNHGGDAVEGSDYRGSGRGSRKSSGPRRKGSDNAPAALPAPPRLPPLMVTNSLQTPKKFPNPYAAAKSHGSGATRKPNSKNKHTPPSSGEEKPSL